MQGSVTRSLQFIKAKSASGLRRLALRNNAKFGMQINYQVTHDGEFWYGWFHEELQRDDPLLKEESKTILPGGLKE